MGRKVCKPPLAECWRGEGKLEREIILLFSSDDRKDLKQVTGISMCLQGINRKLEQRINEINTVCKLNMPYVHAKVCTKDNFKKQDLNLTDIEDVNAPRVIVTVNREDSLTVTPEEFEQGDISHLLQIVLKGVEAKNGCTFINHTYLVRPEELECMILDILVDIAAFHSWDIMECGMRELPYRRGISVKKTEYAIREGLRSRYTRLDASDRYFSFAFASYDEHGKFDGKRFNEIWESFMNGELMGGFKENCEVPSLLEQLQYYSKKGNISIKKLQAQFEELPPGSYLITKIESEPKKNPRFRKQMITYYGLYGSWKNGKIKIIPLENYHEVVRWYPYISFWKVIK
ncbi:MAG: hypothetical protein KH024_08605 [Hungatella hathewayi]|nr:hypothetical protein [Hungatella hathewayi]